MSVCVICIDYDKRRREDNPKNIVVKTRITEVKETQCLYSIA